MNRKNIDEPTAAELAAIEREMPLIEAEMNLLDAQIRLLMAEGRGPTQLDRRRVRRAEHNVLRAAIQVSAYNTLGDAESGKAA